MKRILDPAFHYRPSYDTDVRATFERARREYERHEKSGERERGETPLRLMKTAAAGRRFP
ncbi:MAG TPA: hypothetical protein VLI89_01245 [Burkholderiales bacterium]|jgi:hypothetical protein|nr:hypothetical protein [Burkholderiales bacterium]